MAEPEVEETNSATEKSFKRWKVEKAKAKSAFTRARHQLLELVNSKDVVEKATLQSAWSKLDEVQCTVQDILTKLLEHSVNVDADDKEINKIEIEIDKLDAEFSDAYNELHRRMKCLNFGTDKEQDTVQLRAGPMNVRTEPTQDSRPNTDTEFVGVDVTPHSAQEAQVNTEADSQKHSTLPSGANAGEGQSEPVAQAISTTRNPTETGIGQDMWKQLKRVSIPVFSGDVKVYENWKAAFLACIDVSPVTPEYKLLQLRQYLSGEALKVIENLGHSATAYQAAKDRLDRKYGGKRRQIALRFEELHEFKPIRAGNAKDVEHFADLLDITIINLKDYGLHNELDSKLLYLVLCKKMTESMVTQYQRWVRENGKEESIEVLREWVIKEAEYRTVAHEAIRGVSDLVLSSGSDNKPGRRARAFVTTDSKYQKSACKQCGGDHGVWACSEFKGLTVTQRWAKAKQCGLCFRCLGDNHRGVNCKRTRECGIDGCKNSRHRLLHEVKAPDRNESRVSYHSEDTPGGAGPPTEGELKGDQDQSQNATLVTGSGQKNKHVALRTVPVIVKNGKRRFKVNALLDDASTSTFLNADVAAELGLQGKCKKTEVNVINGQVEVFETMPVEFGLESLDRQVDIMIAATTIKQVTGDLQVVDWNVFAKKWPHLEDIQFPKFGKRTKIDLLIGIDQVDLHFSLRDICGKPGDPIARRTPLGWTCIGGPLELEGTSSHANFARVYFSHQKDVMEELNQSLRQFWEVENLGAVPPKQLELKPDEVSAMSKVKGSLDYRMGRYQVRVPWKGDSGPLLPDNRDMATSRLQSTEKRLKANPSLGKDYSDTIERYLSKGYIRKVEKSDIGEGPKWFLPHFPVVRPDKATTKTRIVFDASAKYQGISLNDEINQGPKMQRDLFDILLRFRKNPVAVACDIEEMYLQIQLAPPDRAYHRFLWRNLDQTQPPQEYEFTRVVFGVNASPFLAQFVAQQNAESHKSDFPMAAETVYKSTYMDDSMTSVPNKEIGGELYRQLSALWGLAGMHARKWLSNSPEVMRQIPVGDRISELRLEEGELPSIKTLGVLWKATEDIFTFQPNPPPADYLLTKRNILRKLATVFDPLGFLSPFIIRGKVLLQELWAAGVDWDDPVEGSIAKKVSQWFKELPHLADLRLPRCLRLDENHAISSMTTHTFVDASQDAYGAVVYILTSYSSGQVVVRLAASKGKVAPLSAISIPRLELMAAVLGVRLAKSVCQALELDMRHMTFWSDSVNVLWWVRGHSRKFKPFVAHRVGEIQESSSPQQWRYVPTASNPADLVTRGVSARELTSKEFWWSGPSYLKQEETNWPKNKVEKGSQEKNKKNSSISVTMVTVSLAAPEKSDEITIWRLDPLRYSSWSNLTRIHAWVLRFLNNCRLAIAERRKGELTPEELQESENCIIRHTQRRVFSEEYQALEQRKPLPRASKLLSLNPKMDDEGLIRCDGRLKNAMYLSFDSRYPVILPRKSWVTKLIIKHFHDKRDHIGGTNQTLADLSSRYWVIAGREAIRDWERACFGCRRRKTKAASQIMAPLPSIRVKMPLRAFARTAVDFAGPFLSKQGRGRIQQKRYLCLFTCLASRAVHLELAWGLDTDSFLNAFNRMVNRRGLPVEMISDNGTNFVRANKELKELINQMDKDKIVRSSSTRGVTWHFNPPLGPHFGGVHETLIKAAKKAISAVVHKADITDEELLTVFTGVEALLNSRPLTYQTADVHDKIPLTPNHFLHGQAGGQFAVEAVDGISFNPKRRWRRVQELIRHVWHRWLKEWLPLLNQRRKWQLPQKNLQVGDVVVVVDAGSARGNWPLGRVVEVFPGGDGNVRVVRLQVGKNILTRPITKLCPLVECEN
ncbi:hypothetical protein HOLleu_04443 [Holothuria leucospilota]|uniref:Integrase catalytic domain-containing protein n=1 Tax=Holothuria leucospilota TaxID=206669 RepID=A0A9Q1CTB5_HOLLE|nr:hypothetical protein HOLleu_04443 [Holothuria leucospilota]